MSKAKPALPNTPRDDYVEVAWSRHPADMPAAVEELYSMVTSDPVFMEYQLPNILKAWCRVQIGDHVGAIRLKALSRAPVDLGGRGHRLRAAIANSIFDFPLPGGKRLGDAYASEIVVGAEAYEATAGDALLKARWLRLVAERLPADKTAEAVLPLAEVERLFEEAKTNV